MNPLFNLNEQKIFASMNDRIKVKLYDQVLKLGLKEMQNVIENILTEERKMHECLKKYKKEEDSGKLSDFDKMNLQLFIVISIL